jgi:excinuclease ABC subunit A
MRGLYGDGLLKIEMHFLPDVFVKCEECKGRRYNKETLEVRYKGKTISDILDMTWKKPCHFLKCSFHTQKNCNPERSGTFLHSPGQPSTTLSGGEAQRIKLATELSKRATGKHHLHTGRTYYRTSFCRCTQIGGNFKKTF